MFWGPGGISRRLSTAPAYRRDLAGQGGAGSGVKPKERTTGDELGRERAKEIRTR